MAQGDFSDLVGGDLKRVYPKVSLKKPPNIAAAEALEEDDEETTGDRGTPDPEGATEARAGATYAANHPRKGKK